MGTAVHLSLDEFLARPEREDDLREELVERELIVSPGPKMRHAVIVGRLRGRLTRLERVGFLLANDFACILGESMPVPDLAAVATDRIRTAVDADGWLKGAPELVIEVASPSNRRLERKAQVYLEGGAEQVWIIYPTSQTVLVLTQSSGARLGAHDTLSFHNITVSVGSIFNDA